MSISKTHFNSVSDTWEKAEDLSVWYMWSELKQIRMIENLKHSKVLDIGTGIGTMAIQAYLHGAEEVFGIDVSENMILKAQKRAHEANCNQNVSFRVMDAKKMSFKNESFDIAICSAVAEIEPDFHLVLSEIQRVLKPGGNLYLLIIQNTPLNRIWTNMMMLLNKKPEWRLRYQYLRTEHEIASILPRHMRIAKTDYFGYTVFNPLFALPLMKKKVLPIFLNHGEPALGAFFSVSKTLQRLFSNSTFITVQKEVG